MLSGSSLVHPDEDRDFHSDGLKMSWNVCVKNDHKVQECIPVGCVPPAAVAVTGGSPHPPRAGTPGADTPQSRHPRSRHPQPDPPQLPPWVWAWTRSPSTSPWVWAWRPSRPDLPKLPPWVWAWKPARHARISVAMHAGIAPWDSTPLLWTDRHL